MGKLNGKVALITGGASGIGEATARLFAEEGARLVIADILDEKGMSVASQLGSEARYVRADVSNESELKAAIDLTVAAFGRLDCLFNNAGFALTPWSIRDISVDSWDRQIAVLLRGVFLGIKHAAAVMAAQGTGSIVNTASVAAFLTGFSPHPYSAAKAAVVQLTRTAASELAESGVRVNCVCPGAIPTPIFAKAIGLRQDAAERTIGSLKEAFKERQPIRRAGSPLDVAQAVLWLATDDSSFVTGQAIVVDGGITLGRSWPETTAGFAKLTAAMSAAAAPHEHEG